ncbi:hypothetical protein FJY94_01955, partial [Candidatus Kaiserbacteria bacterium]|nr:hypothetical protein [Candidatus Kaiserbacteria bacterium]
MHAVAAFFASIITFVSGLFSPPVASHFPANVRATQPAAAAAAQTTIEGNPFNDPAAAAVVAAVSAAAPAPAFSPPPAQTVINQPVVERIIERVVPQGGTISAEKLAAILSDFGRSLDARITEMHPPKAEIPPEVAAGGNSSAFYFVPASQRIDQLSNTTINNPTISGGSISGASITGTITNAIDTVLATIDDLTSNTVTATNASYANATTTNLAVTNLSASATSTLSGNVGIGTASPSHKLDVSGFINTDGTAGGYKIDGNSILYASSTTFSLGIGQEAGGSWITATSTSGLRSIAIGYQALNATPTNPALNQTVENTAIGYQALKSTTAVGNTAVGAQALTANTTGVLNTAFGQWSQITNTTGNRNSSFGAQNLYRNTTGSNNVAIGTYASYYNSSATNTVAVGYAAAFGGGSAYSNQGGTAVGYLSGYNFATSSDYNTLLGYQAGYGITTGSNNIWIGTATSSTGIANLTTGSQNILIGNNISLPSATASGQLNIGNIVFGTGITGTGSTLSTGNVGIGTTTPWGKLSITGSGTGTGLAFAVADSANTPRFVIQDNGNVGIGTNSPTFFTGSGVEIGRNGTSTLRLHDIQDFKRLELSVSGTEARINSGDSAIPMTFQTASVERLRIDASGNVGIGTAVPSSKLTVAGTAPIAEIRDGGYLMIRPTGNTNDFRLTALDAGGGDVVWGGAASTSIMRWANSGNVGIGTAVPSSKLTVAGTAPIAEIRDGGYLMIRPTGNTNDFRLTALDAGGGDVVWGGAASTSIMRWANSGNVGIGTTSPATMLSAAGSGYFTGGLGVGLLNTTSGAIQTTGSIIAGSSGLTMLSTDQGGALELHGTSGSGNP